MSTFNAFCNAFWRRPWRSILRWNTSTKLLCVIIGFVTYLSVAYCLKVSYVPPAISHIEPKVVGVKFPLRRPFVQFLSSGFAATAPDDLFANLADLADNNRRSTIELYENDKLLGPAHSDHADIAKVGLGRFSHWNNNGALFVFSSSDNSDPQTNGRAYWAVLPSSSDVRKRLN